MTSSTRPVAHQVALAGRRLVGPHDRGSVSAHQGPAHQREERERDETARRAEQRGGPQPLGAAALHGAEQQHAEAPLGAVPLAEDGAGQRGRGGELEPVEERRPAAGQLHGAHPERAPGAEGGEDVVGAARRGRQPDGGADEHEEEHGEGGDGRRPVVAAEHDEQARRDGHPRAPRWRWRPGG